jgi:hypothetical protein
VGKLGMAEQHTCTRRGNLQTTTTLSWIKKTRLTFVSYSSRGLYPSARGGYPLISLGEKFKNGMRKGGEGKGETGR